MVPLQVVSVEPVFEQAHAVGEVEPAEPRLAILESPPGFVRGVLQHVLGLAVGETAAPGSSRTTS